jgi:hypothetical protein
MKPNIRCYQVIVIAAPERFRAEAFTPRFGQRIRHHCLGQHTRNAVVLHQSRQIPARANPTAPPQHGAADRLTAGTTHVHVAGTRFELASLGYEPSVVPSSTTPRRQRYPCWCTRYAITERSSSKTLDFCASPSLRAPARPRSTGTPSPVDHPSLTVPNPPGPGPPTTGPDSYEGSADPAQPGPHRS